MTKMARVMTNTAVPTAMPTAAPVLNTAARICFTPMLGIELLVGESDGGAVISVVVAGFPVGELLADWPLLVLAGIELSVGVLATVLPIGELAGWVLLGPREDGTSGAPVEMGLGEALVEMGEAPVEVTVVMRPVPMRIWPVPTTSISDSLIVQGLSGRTHRGD